MRLERGCRMWPSGGLLLLAVLGVATASCAPPAEQAVESAPARETTPTMQLHHLHGLMAHGFEMGMQGASLVMSAAMDMAESVDDAARSHGRAMIDSARSLHEAALKGEVMQQLHAGDVPQGMQATHELGDAVGAVIDLLASMP